MVDVYAQIILATGAAIALILFALNGPLATVLNRGTRRAQSRADRPWTTKERMLLLTTIGSVAALAANILGT